MKHLRGLLFVTIMVIVGLQLTGCEKMPTAPTAKVVTSDDAGMGVDLLAAINELPYDDFEIVKTWKANKIIKYRRGGWVGKRNIGFLYVPPFSMSTERDTRIYAQADLTNKGDLIFTFDPSGMEFAPSAKLVMNYNALDSENVILKYWDSDSQSWKIVSDTDAKSSNYKWDKGLKRVSFDIDHFSIYLITKD